MQWYCMLLFVKFKNRRRSVWFLADKKTHFISFFFFFLSLICCYRFHLFICIIVILLTINYLGGIWFNNVYFSTTKKKEERNKNDFILFFFHLKLPLFYLLFVCLSFKHLQFASPFFQTTIYHWHLFSERLHLVHNKNKFSIECNISWFFFFSFKVVIWT